VEVQINNGSDTYKDPGAREGNVLGETPVAQRDEGEFGVGRPISEPSTGQEKPGPEKKKGFYE